MNDYCFASWYITEKCDFKCPYCFIYNPPKIKKMLRAAKRILNPGAKSRAKHDLHQELDAVIERFLQTAMNITFGFTGGEPFVYPGFIDICQRITAHDRFKIAVDTNLSTKNIDHFIDAVPPEKVEYIYTSLHVPERERLFGGIDSFIDSVVLLKSKGYSVEVNYVMYPPLFDRVEEDYSYCLERGVRFSLKRFLGVHDKMAYPAAYTEEQKALILKFSPHYKEERAWSRDFYGCLCNAGKNLIRIMSNSDITRCVADHTLLGNVFTGFELYDAPQPCIYKTCPCFSPDRLIDDPSSRKAPPAMKVWAAKLGQTRNKLKAWWEQE